MENDKSKYFSYMEEYASCNNVPIMTKEGIEFFLGILKEYKPKRILEIGTAIGYSSSKMAELDSTLEVVTIERNEKMYEKALENIKNLGFENKIKVIFSDALEVNENELGNFDLIFIDAAKAQYTNFFNKYSKLLNPNGVIISDNLDFHGLVEDSKNASRNLRALVRKINNYREFILNHEEYETTIYQIGDGIGISKKRS